MFFLDKKTHIAIIPPVTVRQVAVLCRPEGSYHPVKTFPCLSREDLRALTSALKFDHTFPLAHSPILLPTLISPLTSTSKHRPMNPALNLIPTALSARIADFASLRPVFRKCLCSAY